MWFLMGVIQEAHSLVQSSCPLVQTSLSSASSLRPCIHGIPFFEFYYFPPLFMTLQKLRSFASSLGTNLINRGPITAYLPWLTVLRFITSGYNLMSWAFKMLWSSWSLFWRLHPVVSLRTAFSPSLFWTCLSLLLQRVPAEEITYETLKKAIGKTAAQETLRSGEGGADMGLVAEAGGCLKLSGPQAAAGSPQSLKWGWDYLSLHVITACHVPPVHR